MHVSGRPEGESVRFSLLSEANGQQLLVFPGLPTHLSPYLVIFMPTRTFSGMKFAYHNLKKDPVIAGIAYFLKNRANLKNTTLTNNLKG